MSFLCQFLYRNLKGYRFLVVLAILVTITQVGSDLVAAMPLKFIPSKISNPGSDPACTFPFLDGVLTLFDTPALDPSLAPPPTPPNQPARQPPPAPCPANPTDPNSVLHPRITMHSVNTVQKKVMAMLPIPQVAGVVLAPDLHKVYAADSNDNIVFVINEVTLSTAPIELHKNDSPDALAYDQPDHLVLVSVPGAPANPDESNVVDRRNQNLNLIDALTDKIVAIIPLGIDGQWGDDVGHVKFDPGLHRIFVVVQQLSDPDSPKQNLLPPPGTAWLDEIDPVAGAVHESNNKGKIMKTLRCCFTSSFFIIPQSEI